MRTLKFPVLMAVLCALVTTPVAMAATSLKITTTPARAKVGHNVEMLIHGLKPGEKVKGREVLPNTQVRTVYPTKRANASGVLMVTVKAQITGTHKWTFTGRTSHRKGATSYIVKK
jgi:hypothetical protein